MTHTVVFILSEHVVVLWALSQATVQHRVGGSSFASQTSTLHGATLRRKTFLSYRGKCFLSRDDTNL